MIQVKENIDNNDFALVEGQSIDAENVKVKDCKLPDTGRTITLNLSNTTTLPTPVKLFNPDKNLTAKDLGNFTLPFNVNISTVFPFLPPGESVTGFVRGINVAFLVNNIETESVNFTSKLLPFDVQTVISVLSPLPVAFPLLAFEVFLKTDSGYSAPATINFTLTCPIAGVLIPFPVIALVQSGNTWNESIGVGIPIGVVSPINVSSTGNVTYEQVLNDTQQHPFDSTGFSINSNNPQQIFEVVTIKYKDAYGKETITKMQPQNYFDKNQFQTDHIDIDKLGINVSGKKQLSFNILPGTNVVLQVFLKDKINPANLLYEKCLIQETKEPIPSGILPKTIKIVEAKPSAAKAMAKAGTSSEVKEAVLKSLLTTNAYLLLGLVALKTAWEFTSTTKN